MERKRIAEEVVEVLCKKLPKLPLPSESPDFDYENQPLVPDITDNQLDIAEVVMDLEDAFDIVFDAPDPGHPDMKRIGQIIDFIHGRLQEYERQAAESES